MGWFQAAWDWAAATPSFHAPFSGLVISLLFTQLIKFLRPRRWREIQRDLVWVATAMVLAGAPTLVLFPTPLGAVEALIVAIASPMAYFYGVRCLPARARQVLSADPQSTE